MGSSFLTHLRGSECLATGVQFPALREDSVDDEAHYDGSEKLGNPNHGGHINLLLVGS